MTTLVKGFKFRYYPDQAQQVLLGRTFGCTRYVFNYCLDKARSDYEAYKANPARLKPQVNYNEFSRQLTALKTSPDHIWLNEVSSTALQQSLRRLGAAFTVFFSKSRKGKSGYPNFRSKYRRQSITLTTDGFRVKDGKVYIAKCSTPLNIIWHRELPSQPTSLTISLEPTGRYFISFVCEYQPQPTNGQGIIGIDLGITDIATMSTGETIANPRHYIKAACRLGRLQRQLSKKKPGSKNRDKARLKVAKLHAHIANQRKDFLHQLTTRLVSKNQAIVIEDLAVGNMGRNRHLSKHIMTAGWGMFRAMLDYKVVASSWCRLIVADRYYPSSQLCSTCGERPDQKLKLATRVWTCPKCHTQHQRDDNASKNLANIAFKYPELWQDHPGMTTLTGSYKDLRV